MKKFYSLLIATIIMLAIPMGMNGQTYEQLTSIANIDESAQYVLGIDGTGFHYTGTSSWGKTALPTAQTPIYYTLTKATDGNSFTAQATIDETTYYLQIPTTNTFSMATTAGTNTDIIIGTTQVSGTNYAVANKNNTARHLRINGTNGLRSYAGTTGTMAFFYKVVPASGTTYTVTYHANVTGIDDIVDTYNEGATVTIADNTFSNPGYAFTEWNTEADGNGESYAPGDEIEDIDDDLELYAIWTENAQPAGDLIIDFESAVSAYTDWTFTNMTSEQTGSITAHAGTNYGTTGGKTTASIVTNSKIATPYTLTCYVSKQSTNTTNSTWYIQVSSDGSTWTDVETRSATDMNKGEWKEFTADLTDYTNVYVRVYYSGSTAIRNIDDLTLITSIPSVVAPTFDPADGATFGNEGLSVSITCETPNTVIYYTVDGSTPDNNSTLYEGAITLTTTATINAIAYDGTNYSSVATATYTYLDPNAPGTVNNPYTVAQARAAIDANTGITGVYATGIVSAIPSAWSTQYNNITFNFVDEEGDNNFLQAFRCVSTNDADASTVAVGDIVVVYGNLKKYNNTYEFDAACSLVSLTHPAVAVEAPTFSPIAGTYASAQNVTISCESPSTVIYYTLDGTEPTPNSTLYSEAISVSSTTTIKAVAYAGGDDHSTVATANYYFCSDEDPYTVTEALAFAEYQYPANGIYVSGIVSTAPTAAPTNNGELTYYISVDGEATNQLEVYKGKNLNNEAFTAADDIQVGDIVTVYGNVQVYNSTIEFGSGNYLVSFERPTPVLEDYTLTVEPFENLEIITFVNDEMVMEADGDIQVTEGAQVMLSIVADEGFVIATLMVNGVDHAADIDDEFTYTFTMPGENVTINATAVEYVAPETENYELYSGALVEGDYVIYYNGYALKNEQLGNTGRLAYQTVNPNNDVIAADATIVWHIAPSATEGYWTLYSADAEAFAASTGVKNKAQMLTNGNDDKALWSVTVAESKDNTYEFVNKYNYDNNVNHLLRNNGTNGFACYAAATGGTLSLYKKVEDTPVTETYELTINGYTSAANGWHLIASPVATTPDQVENMTNETFDLYRFNPTAIGAEWENYKNEEHNDFSIVPGQGYLYANSQNVNLIFSGEAYDGDGIIPLANVGFNLVGNPYSVSAVIDREEFYVMVETEEGSKIMPATDNTTIAEMQGIFVEAEDEGESVTFTAVGKNNVNNRQEAAMVMNITQNRGSLIDRAIIRFGEGRSMSKFQLFENGSKLYIPQNGKDYAVVSASEMGEMPVSFKAEKNGTYTISINTENVEMGYLHLIDNMTGNDVDLLATPSYSFNAQTTDYESRFRLVFSADNSNTGDSFAFISNGNLIINGQGTLEVFDITGRMISSTDATQNVSTAELNAGVYMLRLTNGNSVKTQKIVVK